ncbi:hypothetical protein Tco_1201704 [Tanacetum coccineum]
MSFLTSIYSLGNIMDEVDIEDLTIEQYLRLTKENQTPKKIEDMTIAEYVEYEKKMSENYISNTKTYLPTHFSKCAPTHDSIREFAHYFGPNQPGAEKDDIDKWLNAEITKHRSIQGVENTEDALINIIKSIKKEMKDDIMKKQIKASTANIDNETSSIASSEVDTGDDNTSPTASYMAHEEETFNPLEIGIDLFSYESTTCLEFEQRSRNGEDCRMWPTCDPDSKFCFGYNEVFGVNKQGGLRRWICFRDRERRTVKGTYMGFADFLQILDSYDVEEEYARVIGDPYSRRLDEYNRVFKNEIEHLSNEYILRIGKNGIQKLRGNSRDRLDSYSFGNLAEFAAVTP